MQGYIIDLQPDADLHFYRVRQVLAPPTPHGDLLLLLPYGSTTYPLWHRHRGSQLYYHYGSYTPMGSEISLWQRYTEVPLWQRFGYSGRKSTGD